MHLRRFLFTLFAALLTLSACGPPAFAQSTARSFALNAANQCAVIGVTDLPTVGIQVTGTFSATLQPEVSISGQAPHNAQVTPTTSNTSQSTITTTGTYGASVAGMDTFLLCVSSYASGTATVWLNPSAAVNASLIGSGAAGALTFANLQAGTNNSGQALQVGTTSSLAPVGTGQNVGNQLWMPAGVLSTTPSFATSGGSINCGHNVTVRIALNTAAGLTLASASLAGSNASFGCSTGTSAVLTIPAPTLPSGFTGASFYVFDSSSGSGVGNEVLQTSCSNIVTSCVLTSISNSGTAPLTTPTAYLNPANLQASECPPGVIASVFSIDTSGDYHTYEGVDLYSNNGRTVGTPTICHVTAFTDQGVEPVVGNNAFVVIDHTAGVNVSQSVQDRALWVNNANLASDVSEHDGLEAVQAEMDLNGAPTFFASTDAEVTAVSGQVADLHTNAVASPGQYAGVMGGRFSASRSGTGTWGSCHGTLAVCMAGVFSQAFQNNSATYNNAFIAGVMAGVSDQSVGTTTGGVALYGLAPGATLAVGYTEYLENAGAYGPTHFNANLVSASDSTGIQGLNLFHGPIAVGLAGNAGPIATYSVASNGGMAINTLTKLTTSSPVQGAKLATTDTASTVFGICTVYCAGGASTNAVIAIAGVTPLIIDNATTAADQVGISTGTAGDGTDVGTFPTVPVIGQAQTTNGSTGTSNVLMYPRMSPVVTVGGQFGAYEIHAAFGCETAGATTTLSTGATTTNTGLNCLPANSVIDAVVYRITTTITTAASFTIGDSTTAARFCSTQSTLTSGTTGICMVPWTSATAGTMGQVAAASVRVTTNANPGAGAMRLIVYYHSFSAPTS